MNALLAQFIPEARDLLEQAGTGMLALEQDAGSQSVINDVFRAVHTLKGSSGLFDVAPLTRLVHAAEDLLGDVRTGDLALTSEIVDRLLDSLDVVGRWIDALEARETLPGDAEATMIERVAILRSWLADRAFTPGQESSAASPAQEANGQVPDWVAALPEASRMTAFKRLAGNRLLAWTFAPEEDCFFRGDDPVAMVRQSPGLLAVRVHKPETLAALDVIDPLASFLCFDVLADTTRDVLEDHMRYVAERVHIRDIAIHDLVVPAGQPAGGPVFSDFARVSRQHLHAGDRTGLDHSISTLLSMIAPSTFQASALRWCAAVVERFGLDEIETLDRLIDAIGSGTMQPRSVRAAGSGPDPMPKPSPTRGATNDADRELAYRIVLEQIKVLATPSVAGVATGRLDSVVVVVRNLARALDDASLVAAVDQAVAVLRNGGDVEPLRAVAEQFLSRRVAPAPETDVAPVAPLAETPEARTDDAPADTKTVARVLRVDQSKIDAIMNLVAELIVAKNGLSYLATRVEQVHGSRAAAREIKDQFAVIDRITQGLQVGVMSVRMMPVSQVFQRFPRLVRDISRKLGKKIELVIDGEDTEADKNVLESLADPLIHMVRNSLDHGIETPDERRAAGKPEQGILRIAARQENDFVVIEVRDDGKGIDAQRVKAKAVQGGLISAEKAEQMSDQEAANLVFAPGFSTKDSVSDLSGRGVGMDVVRSAVLKAGGDVALQTTLGSGTSVTVRLPLTMAVTRIVTIECCGRMFGIPMDLVVETVRIRREQIHRIKTSETFVLRDAIIPIVRLAQSLGMQSTSNRSAADEEAVMVVRIGRERVGIVVDGFRERLEVIVKPLEGVLEGMPGFSGTALLGDGRVLLILDLQEMV